MDANLNLPLISIIIPAYNAEKYIEASILSVLNQTYVNWELIIVNDGSTDRTQAIAEEFSSRDKRIKVINQQNKRLAAARNTGIKNSTGQWVAFLDADDIWFPSKLEKQVKISEKVPYIDILYTDGWIFHYDDLTNLTAYSIKKGEFTSDEMYLLEYSGNYIPVISVMAKRNIMDKIGFPEEEIFFYGCEDWDCWLRLAQAGANFYGIDEKLFYYRRHDSNMSGKSLQIAQAATLLRNFSDNLTNKRETQSELKKIINPLITRLTAEGKKTEAIYLLKGMWNIGAGWDYAVSSLLVNFAGKYSVIPVRLLMRVNKMLSK